MFFNAGGNRHLHFEPKISLFDHTCRETHNLSTQPVIKLCHHSEWENFLNFNSKPHVMQIFDIAQKLHTPVANTEGLVVSGTLL